jgi:hypothetical protein
MRDFLRYVSGGALPGEHDPKLHPFLQSMSTLLAERAPVLQGFAALPHISKASSLALMLLSSDEKVCPFQAPISLGHRPRLFRSARPKAFNEGNDMKKAVTQTAAICCRLQSGAAA